MSGGSMDYLYRRIEEVTFPETTALRRAFRAHLNKVAAALHDVEWVDSGDYGRGGEDSAILRCLQPDAELVQLVRDAETARKELDEAIDRAHKRGKKAV